MKRKFTAIILREGDGYVARCSEVPDAIGRGTSKEDALDKLREFLQRYDPGGITPTAPGREGAEENGAAYPGCRTALRCFRALPDWENHFKADMKLDRITEEGIKTFLDVQRLKESEHTGRFLTNHTLNLKVYALRSLLRMARDEGKISRLPFNGIKKLKHKPKRKELPPVGDIEQIANTALEKCPRSGQRFADYVHLLMYFGLQRKGMSQSAMERY